MAKKIKNQWWQTVFDDRYLKTYVDIVTPERTDLQVHFLKKIFKKGSKILDLACGYGRHSIALAKLGYEMVGVDYSVSFIQIAREQALKEKVSVRFLKSDIRKLSFKNEFDGVINMFTSFGYFESEEDNVLVLQNITRALKKGGKFILDLNNAYRQLESSFKKGTLENGLLTLTEKSILSNGIHLTMRHQIDPVTFRWRIKRTWTKNERELSYLVDLRMYLLPELKHLLLEAGLKIKKIWGDFKGRPFGFDSPRLIVLAEKISSNDK